MVERIVNAGYGYAVRMDNIRQASRGSMVLSDCLVSDQAPDAMAVDIAAGEIIVNGVGVVVGATSKNVDAADGTNDRYDIISVNSSGVVSYVAGTAVANPFPPDLPSGEILLAIIFVENNSSVVEAGDVFDARIVNVLESSRGDFVQAKAGENVTVGDVVYVKESDGLVYVADKDIGFLNGITIGTVTTGNTVTILTAGKYITSGLSADTVYYLGDAGALTTTAGPFIVGVATSTTILEIDIVRKSGLHFIGTDVASSDSAITVSGISTAYKRLLVEFDLVGTTGTNGEIEVTVNGDTGANYNYSRIQNTTSTVTGGSDTGDNYFQILTQNFNVNTDQATGKLEIYNGTTRTTRRSIQSKTNYNFIVMNTAAGTWESSAQVTSITFTSATGVLGDGSFIRVYGMI